LGGIPRRGIYDNMKTAVDKVNKGKGHRAPQPLLGAV
jgi:transposase